MEKRLYYKLSQTRDVVANECLRLPLCHQYLEEEQSNLLETNIEKQSKRMQDEGCSLNT
jgi:hypothetical protein